MIKQSKYKTIVLFDHLIGGHHYAFARIFAKYLLKLEYRIIIMLPDKCNEIKAQLIESGFKENRIACRTVELKNSEIKRLGRFNEAINTLHLWRKVNTMIKSAEIETGWNVDYVFFCWLDVFLSNYLSPKVVEAFFKYKWSGLFFHPWYLHDNDLKSKASISSIDSVLRSKLCVSIGVHDETIIQPLNQRTGKKIIHFPEIADCSEPNPDYHLAKEVKMRAAGRTSVGLIGLSKRKGLLRMIEMAKIADPSSYFFFFGGKIPQAEYTQLELKSINEYFSSPPENTMYYPDYIQEGPNINAVISALDVLFLIYQNFKSSSNFNTKAAHFRKPVLATNKFWIGYNTNKFRLGETVNEDDPIEALNALKQIKKRIEDQKFSDMRFDDYLKIHHERNLLSTFQETFG